jgi:hypothetical protein
MRQSRKRFECYIDASHVEHWEHQSAVEDPSMALSWTGYVINFTDCQLLWTSIYYRPKLPCQIPRPYPHEHGKFYPHWHWQKTPLSINIPEVSTLLIPWKIFEENNGMVEMAYVPKIWPLTNHLSSKYHFFVCSARHFTIDAFFGGMSSIYKLKQRWVSVTIYMCYIHIRRCLEGCITIYSANFFMILQSGTDRFFCDPN